MQRARQACVAHQLGMSDYVSRRPATLHHIEIALNIAAEP